MNGVAVPDVRCGRYRDVIDRAGTTLERAADDDLGQAPSRPARTSLSSLVIPRLSVRNSGNPASAHTVTDGNSMPETVSVVSPRSRSMAEINSPCANPVPSRSMLPSTAQATARGERSKHRYLRNAVPPSRREQEGSEHCWLAGRSLPAHGHAATWHRTELSLTSACAGRGC